MEPAGGDSFSHSIFKCTTSSSSHHHQQHHPPPPPPPAPPAAPTVLFERPRDLAEIFDGYGVRYVTVARIGELGFTSSTLAGMREEELEDMMATMSHLFRWDLLVGERYGIKAAARAERRRIDEAVLLHHHQQLVLDQAAAAASAAQERRQQQQQQQLLLLSSSSSQARRDVLDALSQEGLSEEPVQQERGEAAGSGGEVAADKGRRGSSNKNPNRRELIKKKIKKKKKKKRTTTELQPQSEDDDESAESGSDGSGVGCGGGERQREHPFIVTEPGEVARAKKNGLDYLFHLYEQCREFLFQVQALAKERGEKCPTKVTNQVFRYAKKVGASYINKPKMRHYVHCYALHCLDAEASDALRRDHKERGENVGAWRQACYKPLVALSARHGWDIDALFSAHPSLSIWYVPTKLRQLCHLARSNATANAARPVGAGAGAVLPLLPSMF